MIRKIGDSFLDVIKDEGGRIFTPLSASTKEEAKEEAEKNRKKSSGCSFHDQRRRAIERS